MLNPNDELRPVVFTRGREAEQLSLRYDPETRTVTMDAVPLEKLNLSDFRRIHGFFRRVQGLRYNLMHEDAQSQFALPPASNPCNEVPKDDVAHTVGGEYFRRDR